MSEKPAPLHNSTSTNLLPEESLGTEKDKSFTPVLHRRETSRLRRIIGDLILLLAILILLTWPWIFFGVVRTKTKHHLNNKLFEDIHNENYLAATQRVLNADLSGLRAGYRFADFYMNHRSTATFVITLIATLASILVGKFFSLSVRRFTQEWVSEKKELQVFNVVLISGFRSKNFPWHLHDFNKHLFGKNRWLAIVTVGAYLGAMTVVTSSVTSLLTPVNIILHEGLTASELDFSANASECLQWFNDTDDLVNNGTCGWQKFEDLTYNICLGQRQMLDALEAGQGQILGSLSGQAENVTFTKISDRINLRFAGQVRGVLPGGPNGVFSLSIGQNSSVADVVAESDVMSYNYTLLQQGLTSQVSCQYANDSPIGFRSFEGSDVISRSTGNCSSVGAVDFAEDPDLTSAVEVNAANLLAYWACQAKPQDGQPPSYLLYFQGQTNYSSTIGNITCTVSPLQPATFPVEFESVAGSFFVGQQIDSANFSSTGFPEDLLFAIGDIVSSAQNFQSNLLADIVIESGVKYHELSSTAHDPAYPDLFASLIQGIMDYEATYNRLIYSASVPQAPPSCTRPIDGWFSYQVIGWNVTIKHVFLLIPMTLVNLASLVMMLSVLFISKGTTDPDFDPTDARQLIYAKHGVAETPDEWEDRVVYLPREASGQTIYHWT